jgi:hypothetical protein
VSPVANKSAATPHDRRADVGTWASATPKPTAGAAWELHRRASTRETGDGACHATVINLQALDSHDKNPA